MVREKTSQDLEQETTPQTSYLSANKTKNPQFSSFLTEGYLNFIAIANPDYWQNFARLCYHYQFEYSGYFITHFEWSIGYFDFALRFGYSDCFECSNQQRWTNLIQQIRPLKRHFL